MRKVTLFVAAFALSLGAFAQTELIPVNWVNWAAEPAGDAVGYAENPYNKAVAVAGEVAEVVDVESVDFDVLWNSINNGPYEVANPTSVGGGDLRDTDFGASFKAIYSSDAVYVLLQYLDDASQADADSRSFEIMFNPYKDRNDTMFATATDVTGQNQAYACYTLWGGKAKFADGAISEYNGNGGANVNNWNNNDIALEALALDAQYWEVDGTTIKAILVADMDSVININPTATGGDDTISFEVKSNAFTGGGTENANKVEYMWSSNVNDAYASLYYRGYLILSELNSAASVRANNITVAQRGNQLEVSGVSAKQVVVSNVVGQEVMRVNNKNIIDVAGLKKGAYIVTVNGTYSTKIVK